MTVKTKITFSLKDLATVKLVCDKCKSQLAIDVTVNPEATSFHVPRVCPWCSEEWNDPDTHPALNREWEDWIKRLIQITAKCAKVPRKFSIELEIEQPKAEAM